MTSNERTTNQWMEILRADIEREQRGAARRGKMWIGLQCLLILFVVTYMTWLSGAISQLDAASITRMAAVEIEEQIPEVRAALRDYAVDMAPELTDQARNMFLEIPARLREGIEVKLLSESDRLLATFEAELDAGLTGVIDDRIEQIKTATNGTEADKQLDTVVEGVSGVFREAVLEAVDELYVEYASEINKLNSHLLHLQRSDELTEGERIDKELLETWMVLVQKHQATKLAWQGPSF